MPLLCRYLMDLMRLGRTIPDNIFHQFDRRSEQPALINQGVHREAALHEKDHEHVRLCARSVHGATDICPRRSGTDRLLGRGRSLHDRSTAATDDHLDLHRRWKSRRVTPSLSAGVSVRSTGCHARSRRVAPFEERRVRRDDRGALPRGSRAFHLARHDDREGKGTVQVPVRQR